MDIKNLFNILLLTLSVTTLVVTFIAYLIFRLRYSLEQKKSKEVHHLKGIFFNRYAPHLKAINNAHQKSIEAKESRWEPWIKSPWIVFLFVGFIVAGIFAAENYFAFRRELTDRIVTANEYRQLIKKGLLKNYEYDPIATLNTKESFSQAFLARQEFLIKAVQSKTVQVYAPSENARDPYHMQAIEGWKTWLKRFEIKALTVRSCQELQINDLIIAPSLNHISAQNAECLLKFMKRGGSVIITGLAGSGILQSEFGLTTRVNPEALQKRPTLFVSESKLAWDIPPGLLLPWFPLDNRTLVHSDLTNALAFQTGFSGIRLMPNESLPVRIILKENDGHRSIWSALDPPSETVENQKYIDNILLSAMAWSAKYPLAKISNWKYGRPSASVITVDGDFKFSNLTLLSKIIKDSGHPVTTYLVSDVYLKNINSLKFLDSSDELGSHTDSHDNLGAFSPEQYFQKIQKSRLDLEENWKKQITGFHPLTVLHHQEDLNIVKQSGYKYIFSGQQPFRYAPVLIGENSFTIVPQPMDDDIAIIRNRLLITPEQIAAHLFAQYEITKRFGGAHILSFHTHVFAENQLFQAGFKLYLNQLREQLSWKTTVGELVNWWEARDSLVSTFSQTEGAAYDEITLTVQNMGRVEVIGAEASFFPRLTGNNKEVKVIPQESSTLSSVKCEAGNCKVLLPTIPAGATVDFRFVLNK